MVSRIVVCWMIGGLVVGPAWGIPTPYQPDGLALPLVDLGRLTSHPNRLTQEARLPLPSAQDLEAIRKVAQILVTLGQQVIPAIIGESPQTSPAPGEPVPAAADEVPNDPVNLDKLHLTS